MSDLGVPTPSGGSAPGAVAGEVWVLDLVGYDVRGGNAEVFATAEAAKASVPHVKWKDDGEGGFEQDCDPFADGYVLPTPEGAVVTAEYPAISAVVIRMPVDLHLAIKAKAATEERSMAQTIRHALRLYVTAEGAEVDR